MGTIETARGPIASDRLGPTLTIVDPTVLGIGRNPPLVQRVAEQVDLNIVLATGVFTTNELPQYFHYRHMLRPPEQGDVLVELFVRDIREGIKGTDGAKAAILKCAIDTPGLTADVERVLRATAVAHRETGVPITTHTDAASRGGLEQQRILAEEGVDLSRVIIGHCGDTGDIDYLEELCATARCSGSTEPALALRAHPARGAAGAARARHAGGDDPDDDGRHAAPAARPPGWILSGWSSSRSAGCNRR
jgi:predicted metal-dependent phosphotriesterase family hydrolase